MIDLTEDATKRFNCLIEATRAEFALEALRDLGQSADPPITFQIAVVECVDIETNQHLPVICVLKHTASTTEIHPIAVLCNGFDPVERYRPCNEDGAMQPVEINTFKSH